MTRLLTLPAVLLVAIAGCNVDHKAVETSITKGMADKKVTLSDVACPPSQPAKNGAKFTCTGKDKKGTQGIFDCEVSGSDVKWTLRQKFLNLKVVGDNLEANLSKKTGKAVDVICPDENYIIAKGLSFTCDVTVGSEKQKITLTAKADDGSDWSEVIK